MASEFNARPVREKYSDFDGKNRDQMPLLLADNRYPMFTTELFEQRLQGRGIGRYLDTGDLIAYDGSARDDQEIKFILTATRNGLTDVGRATLGLINPNSAYVNGAVNLSNAMDAQGKQVKDAYDAITGRGVIKIKRKDLGLIDTLMDAEQVLNHKGWRILMRHPDEVPKEFAEDFEVAREYVNKVVFSKYSKAMGIYLASAEKNPTLRAWCVYGLGGYGGSDAGGRVSLDSGNGRLVGVAPEALSAPSMASS